MIPCNVKEVLSANYGMEKIWSKPVQREYYLHNVDWANGVYRTEFDLPYAIRLYYQNGSINVKATLEEIKKYHSTSNITVNKLPTNDDDFI